MNLTSADNTIAAQGRESMNVASQDFGTSAAPPDGEQTVEDKAGSLKNAKSVVTSVDERSNTESVPKKRSKRGKFDLANEIDGVYSRASNLIREALAAEGALFLDANVSHLQKRRPFSKADISDAPTTSASETDTDMSEAPAPEDAQETAENCPLLGFSTRIKSSLRGFLPSQKHLSLPKRFLGRLIRRYPAGHIFNFNQRGSLYSESGEDNSSSADTKLLTHEMLRKLRRTRSRASREAAALGDVLSGVQSAVFLPLWDVRRMNP